VDCPEISLGERLSGWVAAHRTAIWNSDATLDLPADVASRANIVLGSSVPLIDNDMLVGTLTLYSAAGKEIAMEQRLLISSIAPLLAAALSSSTAHDEVVAIDATQKAQREALYSIIDTLLSNRSRWPNRNNPDRLTIVHVNWNGGSTEPEKLRARQAIVQRAIASATNGTGHLLRLSATESLITAPLSVLGIVGLAPSLHKSARTNDVGVVEITNSLQLREALGLINTSDTQAPIEKPSIH
jgi:hypothetical protein